MNRRNAFILCFLFLTSVSSFAVTRYLPAPSYNSALQPLINQSAAGDVIVVRAGSHYITSTVRLPVGKNRITIQGENGAVLRKADVFAAMEISGTSNTLTNLDLDGGMLPEAGIIVYGDANRIYNSLIHNCRGAGILLHEAHRNLIQGCKSYYNDGVGISQYGCCDGRIQDCQMYENGREGLTIDCGSHNNDIVNCWIYYNCKLNGGCGGVGIDGSNGNYLYKNTIDYTRYRSGVTFNNQWGNCDGNILDQNNITRNAQWGVLSEENPYYTTNTGFWSNTFSGNGLLPNIYFR